MLCSIMTGNLRPPLVTVAHRLSEIPEDATTLSYTHNGTECSECSTRLTLSVPIGDYGSCCTTGPDAHRYSDGNLPEKAFDEDWMFDLEKTKQGELAWRAANPLSTTLPPLSHLPAAVSIRGPHPCLTVDATRYFWTSEYPGSSPPPSSDLR